MKAVIILIISILFFGLILFAVGYTAVTVVDYVQEHGLRTVV